jgi:anthranilate phosphoribosyltransferase
VNIEADVTQVETCLDELGICFCFAPLLHAAMKHVAAVRKRLGHPTIFNILGPLANPARTSFQLLGVGKPHLQSLLAEALVLLGTRRALVVHGEDGLDEVTLAGTTHVIEAADGKLRQFDWTPADFGLDQCSLETLRVQGPAQSAEMIRQILAGRKGPACDIVVINAAAALWTAGRDSSLRHCARLAAEVIENGQARQLLQRLVTRTHG